MWVVEGVIQPCAHPLKMRRPVCYVQMQLAGLRITKVDGAERRWCGQCQTPAAAPCASHLDALV